MALVLPETLAQSRKLVSRLATCKAVKVFFLSSISDSKNLSQAIEDHSRDKRTDVGSTDPFVSADKDNAFCITAD